MYQPPVWTVDPTRILTRRELATVLADAAKNARYANARRNLVIVRLACCCGLRVSEIGGLQLDDVVLGVPRPHLRLRRQTTKGKRARTVPLWWDSGTLADLAAWKAERVKQAPVATTRSSAACRRIAWGRRFGGTLSGGDSSRRVRSWAGPGRGP